MAFYRITCSNGFFGCDETFYEEAKRNEINSLCLDILNFEYSFRKPDDRFLDYNEEEGEDAYEEACDAYYDGLSVWWEEISEEEYREEVG